MKKPILIHLKTTKGKGYKFAEEKPEVYHGVPCFNVGNGEPTQASAKSFAAAFGESLLNLAGEDKKICAITAAMQSGTGLDEFAEALPDQFFDVGIAEGHAVTMAGGLAKQGMIPVCAIYATFLQRAYDMLFHDVCLTNQHVVFAIDRAGLVAEDGPTHQGIFDVGILLQMPNMRVFCPSCISQLDKILEYAVYKIKGPVAIRYPRGGCDCYLSDGDAFEPMLLKEGKDVALVTYGRLTENVMEAAEILGKKGMDVAVVKLTEISGALVPELIKLLTGISKLYVIEECVEAGCVASKLALEFSSANIDIQVVPINLGNEVAPPASAQELMVMYGLDAQGLAERIKR